MMRCFVINLKRSVKRREYVQKHLNECEIPFEFFDAVDGRTLSEEYVKNVYSEEMSLKVLGRELSLGEIGCSLSHIHLYKKMIDEAIPVTVILEDDCEIVVRDKFKEVMRMSCEDIHPFNLVLLYHEYSNEKGLSKFIKYFGRRRLMNGLMIAKPVTTFSCTVGYVITQEGARLMFKNVFPLRRPMDSYTAFSEMYGLTIGIISEPLVVQNHSFESDIWNAKVEKASAQPKGQAVHAERKAIHVNKWIRSIKHALFKSNIGFRLWGIVRELFVPVIYFFLRLGIAKWYKFHTTTSTCK